ncbi:IclR family transcriptional regulator [Streptomyces sp. NPDC057694]|uniref:IclR family transcriptional regulator n=1 Tax=Streptomyces sp. NPDC057694 TaxID=3346216 RepID=UPI0036940278
METASGSEPGRGDARKPRGRRPPVGEPLLDKAFRILETFSDNGPSLTLTQLSAATGIPISTAFRISQNLVRHGALEQADSGEYAIGLRLLELATLAPRGHGLRHTALPFMEDLHRATGQHVLLGVRDGDAVVLTERLSATKAAEVDYRVGGRMPLHATGIGLVLLAHSPTALCEAYLRRELEDDTGQPVSSKVLRERLGEIRVSGVAHNRRTQPAPAWSVAAPVMHRGRVVAALSVVAADGSADARGVEPAVVAIARGVSRELDRTRLQDDS